MNKKTGRKTKLTEQEVNELIYLYKIEKQLTGKIKYRDIHLFNQELVKRGRFPVSVGEDFWRKKERLGRIMVDKANSIFTNKLAESESIDDTVINFTQIIDHHYSDKEKLVREMVIVESKFYKNNRTKKSLEKKLLQSEENLQKYKDKLFQTEKQLTYLKELVFNLMRYSAEKETPLIDHLTTGKKRTSIVKRALEDIFNSPSEFYTWYEEKALDSHKESNNVIPLRKDKTLADEFNDIF